MRVSAPFAAAVRLGGGAGAGAGAVYFEGLATNLSRHEGLQNQYVVPAWSALPPAARSGVTSMSQTGSLTVGPEGASAGFAGPA